MQYLGRVERSLVAGIERWLITADEVCPIPEQMAGLYLRARHSVLYAGIRRGRWKVRSAWKVALTQSVEPGHVVFDVGANIGLISQPAAWLVGRRGQVHAFEPSPAVSESLRRRVELLRLRNVVTNRCAVGRTVGQATLYEYESFHGGASSLRPETRTAGPHDHETTVPVDSIDRYVASCGIQRVDFIKIDVEGAELEVLEGAGQTLGDYRPALFIEASPQTLAAFGSTVDDLLAVVTAIGYEAFSWRGHAVVPVGGAHDIPPDWQHDDLICLDPVRHGTILARLRGVAPRRNARLAEWAERARRWLRQVTT